MPEKSMSSAELVRFEKNEYDPSTEKDEKLPNDKLDGLDTVEGKALDDETDGFTSNANPLAPKMQNRFQARRNITQGMYDVALLMANVSQLKTVLDHDDHKYYIPLLVLLIASISLHIISAVILYIIMIIERNKENKREHLEKQKSENNNKARVLDVEAGAPAGCAMCSHEICQCWKVSRLDGIATFGVFAVTMLNIFITAFLSDRKE